MKLKIVIIACLFFGSVRPCFSQKAQTLIFSPTFGSATLSTENYYKTGEKDSIQITELKFYVSDIELWQEQKLVWKEKKSFHLVDISDPKSLSLALNLPSAINFTEIKFNLGIDSVTNVSGAMGGALDPILGMYWAWQSGYINLKLEGKSNLCKTRNNEFQFHLGGYLSPFLGLQHVNVKSNNTNNTILTIDVQK
ncbi:MAG TPA: MbnP family protein, partial [Bacteroidia bacterium]|nr:MbnP family protein [Bacteroidia bacterium]